MSSHSDHNAEPNTDQTAHLTGVVEFTANDRPAGPFTVTVLVEDVSKADAPSTIVGGHRFDHPAFTPDEVAELPFTVSVPLDRRTGIRRLNVRVHLREHRPGTTQTSANETSRSEAGSNEAGTEQTGPQITRPDVTGGDFVSTQSHPVPVFDASFHGASGQVSVRVPVQRV